MFRVSSSLLQAAVAPQRTPLIKFLGPRVFPDLVQQTSRQPHPASPTGSLPTEFSANSHSSFSSYRDHAQQHGPLQKTIRAGDGIGLVSGSQLGDVKPAPGMFFDRTELGAQYARLRMNLSEIEAIESGGAALLG